MTVEYPQVYELFDEVIDKALIIPERLTGSQWADRYAILPDESSGDPGKWTTLPYQIDVLDSMCDSRSPFVTVQKSSRVGYTKMLDHQIGYFIHQEPSPIVVLQPTDEDAEEYSKDEISTMIRDTPVLRELVAEEKSKSSGNTIKRKMYPGGILYVRGATSPRGFRRITTRVTDGDEVDGMPATAGNEGDQLRLLWKRSLDFWNRKNVIGSSPTNKPSRIATHYRRSDMRRRYVPCPECGHMAVYKFSEKYGSYGEHVQVHLLKFDSKMPSERFKFNDAWFLCKNCGCAIDYEKHPWMDSHGQWRSTKFFKCVKCDDPQLPEKWMESGEDHGVPICRKCDTPQPWPLHIGYHIWAAYSYQHNAAWGFLAKEFLEVKDNPEELRTWINTTIGEEYEEFTEIPDSVLIYQRNRDFTPGIIPRGGLYLVCGADVQTDRIEYEVIAYGRRMESWSIEYGVLWGDPREIEKKQGNVWDQFDELLEKQFKHELGGYTQIQKAGVDGSDGNVSNEVYLWSKRHSTSKVLVIKGSSRAMPVLVGQPTKQDIKYKGKRLARKANLYMINTWKIKSEIYSFLNKPQNADRTYPYGFCHFPHDRDQPYFDQLISEQEIKHVNKKTGFLIRNEWRKVQERNEGLDCRVIGRACAFVGQVDQKTEEQWREIERALMMSTPVGSQGGGQERSRRAIGRMKGG